MKVMHAVKVHDGNGVHLTAARLKCGHWIVVPNARGTRRRRMIASEQECPICKEGK
jgi:hypothetical protein